MRISHAIGNVAPFPTRILLVAAMAALFAVAPDEPARARSLDGAQFAQAEEAEATEDAAAEEEAGAEEAPADAEAAPAEDEAAEAAPEEAPADDAAPAAEEATEEEAAPAEEAPAEVDPIAKLTVAVDTLWVLIAAFLVFWMNTGFGCVEAGLCRAKNATNILGKNFVVFAIASLAYFVAGWGIMFGDGNKFLGTTGFFLIGPDNSPATGDAYSGVFGSINWSGIPLLAKFFFQLVFAGTAATIVSGCVAERIHYGSFMIFTIVICTVFYPVTGHWIWGGGWLYDFGFWDFAGSTVVHSVGGWAGLAGIVVLGPRMGKYGADGRVHPIPGHSMALVFLGGFILWLGWFGFNPGSTMGMGDGSAVAHVVMTTNTACVVAVVTATLLSWIWMGKPDFTMTVNGALAGLVAITAPCAFVSVAHAAIIGLVAGLLVVPAVVTFDKLKIDDPVGALSVHLVNGIWGTLSIGLFASAKYTGAGPEGLFMGGGMTSLIAQAVGVVAVGAYTFVGALIVWIVIDKTMGIRVTPECEAKGLDLTEMGMEAYGSDPVAGYHA